MAGYVGDVAIPYDRDLGHVLFESCAADILIVALYVPHINENACGFIRR